MDDHFLPSEFKLTIAALLGYGISLTQINEILQALLLVVSTGTAIIGFYKAIKHKTKQ